MNRCCSERLLSWFKLYFNCYKYKHIIAENIKYPGSDKKPKACTKVISLLSSEVVLVERKLHQLCWFVKPLLVVFEIIVGS